MKANLILNRVTAGIITTGAIYLFVLITGLPVQLPWVGLNQGQEIVDNFRNWAGDKPMIYPSQRDILQRFAGENWEEAVEGFSSLCEESLVVKNLQSFTWPVSLHKVTSWLVRNNIPEDRVSWLTETCSPKKDTTFLFSGALGIAPGKSELWVNKKLILTFCSEPENRPKLWENNNCKLCFVPLANFIYESGIFALTLPKNMITPGKPLLLEVKSNCGSWDKSFFALHDQTDTLKLLNSEE